MEFNSFDSLQLKIQEFYQAGEYSNAIALVDSQTPNYPEQHHLLAYWRATLAASSGDKPGALKTLQEVIEGGFWYGHALLRNSPAFAEFQGDPGFEEVVILNQETRARDPMVSYPILTLRGDGQCESPDSPCPLLIGLHENWSTAHEFLPFCRPAASSGWLTALPQSSQAMWKDAYVWDNLQISGEEISSHFLSLDERYAIDPEAVIIKGLGRGAEIAIWMALTQKIPSNGFIAIGPKGPFMDNFDRWREMIAESQLPPLRGYFIVGEQDKTLSIDLIRELGMIFNQEGIPCEMEIISQVGNQYDPEYDRSLLNALEFVMV